MSMGMVFRAFLVGFFCYFGALIATAQSNLPSNKYIDADAISPGEAGTYYSGRIVSDDTVSVDSSVSRRVKYDEIARALNGDPELAYDYVLNRVDLHPVFGLSKGAYGAYIDRSGSPFDQSELLFKIFESIALQIDSLEDPKIEYGQLSIETSAAMKWYGAENPKQLCEMFASGGVPFQVVDGGDCADLQPQSEIKLLHAWVSASVNGVSKKYDPSLRARTSVESNVFSSQYFDEIENCNISGLENQTHSALSKSSISITSAGTNYSVPDVSNFSDGAIRDILNTCSDAIIERAGVVDSSNSGSFPEPSSIYEDVLYDVYQTWDVVPNAYRTLISLNIAKQSTSLLDKTFFADEVYQSGFTLRTNDFSHLSQSNNVTHPNLCGQDGQNTYFHEVSLSPSSSRFSSYCDPLERHFYNLTVSVDHPYASTSGNYGDRTVTQGVDLVSNLIVKPSFGYIYEGDPEKNQIALSGLDNPVPVNRDQNTGCFPECDPPAAFDGSVRQQDRFKRPIARKWSEQNSRIRSAIEGVSQANIIDHHSIITVSSRTTVGSYSLGDTIANGREYRVLDQAMAITIFGSASVSLNDDREYSFPSLARTYSMFSALLEGNVVEQMMGVPYSSSVPTRFHWANLSQRNLPHNSGPDFYGVDPQGALSFRQYSPTSPGAAPTLSTFGGATCVDGSVCTHYPAQQALAEYFDAGYTAIIPSEVYLGPGYRCGQSYVENIYEYSRGNSAVGVASRWSFNASNTFTDRGCIGNSNRGTAFIAATPDFTDIAHVQVNALHNSKGGGGGGANPEFMASITPPTTEDFGKNSRLGYDFSIDPVSSKASVSSGYILTTGQGAFPRKMSFSRNFTSGTKSRDEETWKHNWDISLDLISSASVRLEPQYGKALAPTLVSVRSVLDVFNAPLNTPHAQVEQDVTSALIVKWWADQLINNVVILSMGAQSEQFIQVGTSEEYHTDNSGKSRIIRTGNPYWGQPGVDEGVTYQPTSEVWKFDNLDFEYISPEGNTIDFQYWQSRQQPSGLVPQRVAQNILGFHPVKWDFVTGDFVNFTYDDSETCIVVGTTSSTYKCYKPKLLRVTNNLGRYLAFTPRQGRQESPSAVTSDQGQRVLLEDRKLTLADNTIVQYEISTRRRSNQARPILGGESAQYISSKNGEFLASVSVESIATPQVSIAYNSDWSVKTSEDALGHLTSYHSDGFSIGLSKNPLTEASLAYLNDRGQTHASISALGTVSIAQYDELGRPISSRTYDGQACDDIGEHSWSWSSVVDTDAGETLTGRSLSEPICSASGRLISFSQTDYDRYNNVVQERVFGVPYDIRLGSEPLSVTSYDVVLTRYGYEDSTWPTKPTHTYDPRHAAQTPEVQRERAAQQWYDGETGLPTLSIGSAIYCTDIDDSWSAIYKKTAETFTVERSGQSQDVAIKSYGRCAASFVEYDDRGRPLTQKISHSLQNAENPNPKYEARTFMETQMSYYPDSSAQKGALQSATLKGWTTDGSLDRVTQFDWDAIGNLTRVTDPRGYETTAQYDALRRIEAMSAPGNQESRYAYDPAGRLRAISKRIKSGEWAVTRADYYANGQVETITDPDGDVTASYVYDDAGRVDTVTDAEGRVSKTLYHPNGQTRCMIKAYGTDLQQAYASYDYAPDGQVIAQRPAKGSDPHTCEAITHDYDTRFTYDEFRRLYETTFPRRDEDAGQAYASGSVLGAGYEGNTYSRSLYDRGGNITHTRTRGGHLQEQILDLNGTVMTRTVKRFDTDSGAHIPESRYDYINYGGSGQQYYARIRSYDALSNSYSNASRRMIYTYSDERGNVLAETYREGAYETLSQRIHSIYSYDVAGNMTRLLYQDLARAMYSYDEAGRLEGAGFMASVSAPLRPVAQMEFDYLGRRIRDFRGYDPDAGDSASPAPGTAHGYSLSQFDYDADSDLQTIRHRMARLTSPSFKTLRLDFDYDLSGKMKKYHAGLSGWRYAPDAARSDSFTPANTLDQYDSLTTQIGSDAPIARSFDYDGTGNLTSDGSGRIYSYNAENQLIRVTSNAAGAAIDMQYLYDALGRRSHSIDHIAGTETLHKHSGQMEVEDLRITRDCSMNAANGANAICPGDMDSLITGVVSLTRNIIGAGVDERLGFHAVASDTLTFPLTNHQGSTLMLVAEDGQLVTSEGDNGAFVYDEYGGSVGAVSPAGYMYRYTGRRLDAQTGLYYYRARYYDPETARFLQTDPIGYEDQMNLYAYVGNDPINNTDPTGLCENDPKCGGEFSESTANTTWPQTNDGLQDFFNFRSSPQETDTFVADPSRFGIESQIDVGSQIQSSIANGGRARPYYDAAVKNGGKGEFVMENVGFGIGLTNISSKAGQGIGRFKGDVTGTITVAKDGSYSVSGVLSLDYGPYDWTPDRERDLGNFAISVGGARWNVLGPSSATEWKSTWTGPVRRPKAGAVRYRDGVKFTPIPNRTYKFTATGE